MGDVEHHGYAGQPGNNVIRPQRFRAVQHGLVKRDSKVQRLLKGNTLWQFMVMQVIA